jgi:hypothetical protein
MNTFRRWGLPAIIASAVLVSLPGSVAGPGPEHRTGEGSRSREPSPGPVAAADPEPTHPRRPLSRRPLPLGSPSASPLPGETPSPSLRGIATWYDYRPGEAAAGPALRRLLGRSWRGTTVTVRAGDRRVTVRLTDWCACPGGRIVDLDRRSFALLAAPSRGIVKVKVIER